METRQPANANAFIVAVKKQFSSERTGIRATAQMFRCLFVALSLNFCFQAEAQINTLDNLGLTSATPSSVAYSLRRLSSTYTGPVLRIRRSNDNELRDVYFDGNGVLSLSSQVSAAGGGTATTTTLQTWIGSNSGTVAIWYDQSGNSRNISNSTTSRQPTVVASGVLQVNGTGKPRVWFNGSNWLVSSYLPTTQPVSVSAVWQFSSASGGREICGWGNNAGSARRLGLWIPASSTSQTTFGMESSGPARIGVTPIIANTTYVTNQVISSSDFSTLSQRVNGVTETSFTVVGGATTLNITAGEFAVGTVPGANDNHNFNGGIQELVLFLSALSTTERETIECSQGGIGDPSLMNTVRLSGNSNPISVGTTSLNLSYSGSGPTQYSITWSTTAAAAGFQNVTDATLPAGSVPIAVPASGPVAGSFYAGLLRFRYSCSNYSSVDYPIAVYFTGNNNALDSLGLTASNLSSVAYGLRKLSSTYSGPALRIRRSSDGELRDVYFNSSGVLSLASLVSAAGGGDASATTLGGWIGANSGTVATWYDQSGQWRNAYQDIVANQPRVINAGVIETQNGKPAIFLNGVASYLVQSTLSVANPYSINTVASRTATWGGSSGGYQRLIHLGSTGDGFGFLGANAGNYATFTGAGNGGATWNDVAANSPAFSIGSASSILTMTAASGAGGLLPYRNGLAQTAKTGTAATSTGFTIGATYVGTNTAQLWTGYISDFEIFPAVLPTSARTALECNQGTFYAITPTITLGTLSPVAAGNTTATLPYTSSANAVNYSITWNSSAASAGFANVPSTALPASPISVPVPANASPGQYTGVLTVSAGSCLASSSYSFTITIFQLNTLDNLGLTSATPSSVAYSLRRLSSAYTGPVLRIRRSSDNELRDVYFDGNGVLSLNSQVSAAGGGAATATTLQTWIGSNSGTVAIWYDQSGNTRNIFNGTAALQPTIIVSGALRVNSTGRPRVEFNSSNSNYLINSSFLPTTQPVSLSAVWQFTSIASPGSELCGWGNNAGGGRRLGAWINFSTATQGTFGVESSGPARLGGTVNANTWYVTNQVFSSSNYSNSTFTQRVNGATDILGSGGGTLSITAGEFAVGAIPTVYTAPYFFNGSIQELVLFPAALSDNDRIAQECTQRVFYSIVYPTVTAASSTPTVCINTAMTSITHTTTNTSGIGTPTGLPAGVTASWASNTITISGTPSVSGTFNYSIPLTPSTQGCGTVNATGTITVLSNTISLSSAAGTDAQTPCINTAITNITYATTTATGATVSGLPAGVTGSWVSNVFTISGTPTASGTFNYTVTMTGGCTGGTNTASGSITVNANNTPSVSIVSDDADNTICAGTGVTFTATPSGSGGGTVSYQWKLNGANVGSNSSTYSNSSLTNGNAVSCSISVSGGTCMTATTANSNSIAITVTPNTWNGTADTDWNNAANWSCGAAPVSGSDVVISSSATNLPALSGNISFDTLDIATGKTIFLNGTTLTINGAVTGEGSITGSHTSGIVLGGAAGSLRFTQSGTGNFLKNLTLNDGASATLANPLNITAGPSANSEGTVTVTGSATLATDGNLTLKSNANGTARVAPGRSNGGYITGAVSVERFIPQNSTKSWRLLAANTQGQSINAAWQEGQAGVNSNTSPGFGIMITGQAVDDADAISKGFDKMTPGYSVLRYMPEVDALWGVTNTLTTNIDDYSGYFVFIRGDRANGGSFGSGAPNSSTTLRSKGSLLTGDRSPITIPSGQSALIGNPYPSRIDLRNVSVGSGIVNAFQVWDPKLSGSYGLGAYQTLVWNGSNYTVTPGGGSYGSSGSVQNFIESGSAFFMESASNNNNTVTITESCKTSGSNVVNRPSNPASVEPSFTASLYAITSATATKLADGNRVDYDASYSNAKDVLDVRKNYNFGENLGLFSNNVDLIVERRSLPTETDTIFYSMSGLKRISYRLDFLANDLAATGLSAVLEDTYLNTSMPVSLEGATSYTFSVDANAGSSSARRFRIVFRPQAPLPVTLRSVRAWQQQADIKVEWTVANQLNISRYVVEKSTDGRNFSTVGTVAASGNTRAELTYNWLDTRAVQGANYYRIKSVGVDGAQSFSAVVKVVIGKLAPAVSVYPNPVEGGQMNLNFSNMKAGAYQVRLLNALGQTAFVNKISHNGGSANQVIAIPLQTVAGLYSLEVIAPDGQRFLQQITVE